MITNKSRLLDTFELVEHFVINVLGVELTEENYGMVPKIVEAELNLENFDHLNVTYNSKAYRNYFSREDEHRLNLRKAIVEELLVEKRLASDDDIQLGKGGAAPIKPLRQDGEAFIIIGLPASGKSKIANHIADEFGAYILDSDYAKRKLPEYEKLQFGATLVHEESTNIIFGESKKIGFKSLLQNLEEYKINCVIPKIGSKIEGILHLNELLNLNGYKCHIILIELDRIKSTRRALKRFMRTKRYVPLGLIFDGYANEPSLTYYKLKSDYRENFESFGIISTDVNIGESPKFVEGTENSPVLAFKEENDG